MRHKRLVTLLGSVCLILVLAALPFMAACPAPPEEVTPTPPPPEKPIIMRFNTVMPLLPMFEPYRELEEIIPEATNGRVKYEMHTGGGLYSTRTDALIALRAGDLQLHLGGFCLATVSPEFDVICTNLPLLFDDAAHVQRFLETDIFKQMEDKLEAEGIKCITPLYSFPPVHIFNDKKSIERLEDFPGVKLRIPVYPAFVAMTEILGIQGIKLTVAEVATSLETGLVDGCINDINSSKAYGAIENCRYVTICNLCFPLTGLVISTKWWNSLPVDLQPIIEQCLIEAQEKSYQLQQKEAEANWAEFKSLPGHEIYVLDKAERDRWVELVKPLHEEYMAKSDEFRKIIEAVYSVK